MTNFALVPAYNEEKNIGEVISRLKKIKSLKIVVVDDGSRDKTSSVARRYKVKVIRHQKNLGKGEAVRTGLREILQNNPDASNIVLIDSDLQFDPEDAPKILQPLLRMEADFVTGYRNFKNVPFRHRLGNFVWRNFFNILFGTRFKDTNCGYIAMNRRAASIMQRSIYGGYILESAMFIEALRNRLKIKQVSVNVHYRYSSEVPRGIRVVLGVSFFILSEGLKYRLGLN